VKKSAHHLLLSQGSSIISALHFTVNNFLTVEKSSLLIDISDKNDYQQQIITWL
jgi:hypothetical protein